MTTSVLKSLDSMLDLRDAWGALANRHRSPLLDFDWHYACAETFHKDDQLHILVHDDASGMTAAIAPLVLNGRKQLEFLGASYLYEPSDILCEDPSALGAIYDYLASSKYPAHLNRIPPGSAYDSAGTTRSFRSGYWLRASSADAPVLDLGVSWDEFYGSLSSKRRYDCRRAAKRASALGPVSFEVHSPTREEVPELLNIAYDIEDRGWKGRSGSSLKRNPRLGDFFRRYCEGTAAKGNLRIFFQRIGDDRAAMGLCVEKYGALWFLKIGYDERFRKCSPGLLLLMNSVRNSCETGVPRIEHLGTAEPWLEPWTSFVREYVTVMHYPVSLTGFKALGTDFVGRAAGLVSRSWTSVRQRSQ